MTNYKLIRTFLVLFILCLCGLTGFKVYNQKVHYHEARFLFDTEVYIEAHGWGAKNSVEQAMQRMAEISQQLDKFSEGSELSRINQASGIKPVKVSNSTFAIIDQALQISEMTKGAFDPTVGPLMLLWGFGGDKEHSIPSDQEIKTCLEIVDYRKVILNQDQKSIYLPQKGMILDLGAIAKGFAVDEAAHILRKENITSALISAGGNIYTIGKKPDHTTWRIGIRDPAVKEGLIGYVHLENQASDTSGDYERFFWAEGKKYSHIIDPRTGYPVQGVSGCSVIASQAVLADALATALFVMGDTEGLRFIENKDIAGLFIKSDGHLQMSSKMKELLIRE